MIEGRIITAGVMLALFVTAVAIALMYFAPGARTLPLVIGIPGILLSGIQFISELRQKEGKKVSAEDRRAEIGMVLWFTGFVAAVIAVGFIIASPIMVAAYMLIATREKWLTAIIGAVLVWAIMDLVFERSLGLVLFEGLLPPMLGFY
jgi:O-antigen/teichoic acid export membrane protein